MRVVAVLTAALALIGLGTAGQTSDTQDKASNTELIQQFRALEAQGVEWATVLKPKPAKCDSAERAIVYYRGKVWGLQTLLGESKAKTNYPERKKNACGYKRWVAKKWQAQAKKLNKHYEYHFAWEKWLPAKWQRIGACETGYGKVPGVWTWNSGKFQGAFGFYHGTWDQYKPAGAPSEAYLATPRQQYEAALNVYRVHGYRAWGCGGA